MFIQGGIGNMPRGRGGGESKKCLFREVYIVRGGGGGGGGATFAIIVICRGVWLNNGIAHYTILASKHRIIQDYS